MIKYMIPCTVRALLADTSFLRYVLDDDAQCRSFWTNYQRQHPEIQAPLEEATYILHHLGSMPCLFDNHT